jgi:serine protease Do
MGIVTRSCNLPDDSTCHIQTDGDQSGRLQALFSLNGEVIGMNSQIYSRSGGYMGLSFAIPIDVAMNVSHQLRTAGHVTRGRLGVGIQDVNQALAESFGLDKPRGALVSNVEKGGPSEKAGLKAGDVILAFNSQPVGSAGDLPAMVARATPGQTAEVEIWREGSKRSVRVELGEVNEGSAVAANRGDADSGRLGLQVRRCRRMAREADVSSGLVVEDVGAAADAGIRRRRRPVGQRRPTRSIADYPQGGRNENHVRCWCGGDTRATVPSNWVADG